MKSGQINPEACILMVSKYRNKKRRMGQMKTNYRLILAAVILACIAALGFSHSVWAGPLSAGTVPSCPITGTIYTKGKITTCHAVVQAYYVPKGYSVTSTEIDISSLGLPRRGKFTYGVQVTVLNASKQPVNVLLNSVCFPDPTGQGIIFRYFTKSDWLTFYHSNEPGRWVVSPTYHQINSPAGYTCTINWLPGTFTIVY
jgi:hypothetical protein